MLDARGNLDLESPEELLTSSGTPGPRARHCGPGPLRAYSFLALNFCIMFRDVLLFSFFMFLSIDFDAHLGSMLASFSMFFA